MLTLRTVAIVATTLLMTTSAAFAGDGVIEINAAAAAAGGVTATDTPGYPVTIDAPGSYRLTGNLKHHQRKEPEAEQDVSKLLAGCASLDDAYGKAATLVNTKKYHEALDLCVVFDRAFTKGIKSLPLAQALGTTPCHF